MSGVVAGLSGVTTVNEFARCNNRERRRRRSARCYNRERGRRRARILRAERTERAHFAWRSVARGVLATFDEDGGDLLLTWNRAGRARLRGLFLFSGVLPPIGAPLHGSAKMAGRVPVSLHHSRGFSGAQQFAKLSLSFSFCAAPETSSSLLCFEFFCFRSALGPMGSRSRLHIRGPKIGIFIYIGYWGSGAPFTEHVLRIYCQR